MKRSRTFIRAVRVPIVVVSVAVVLVLIPGRSRIAPVVESDYVYQLIAADRMAEGHGFTSLQPVAPLQPWEWEYDWGFLTQWPVGYPLLVWLIGAASGLSSLAACRVISVVACALALVGWYKWVRRSAPQGAAGILLATVAAGSSVSVAFLASPSTDALLVGMLPFVLLATMRGIEPGTHGAEDSAGTRRAWPWLALAGLGAGGLFWIRYASLFVPAAIGFCLLCECCFRRSVKLRHVALFAVCAAAPIAGLVGINRAWGSSSLLSQFNVGHQVGFDFHAGDLTTAWWNFTDFGFYDYRALSHYVYAVWPAILIVGVCCIRGSRRMIGAFLDKPDVTLSALTVFGLFGMLIGTRAVFGDKFDYVTLERYYLPIRPLYFVLFVAPLLLSARWQIRAMVGMGLLIVCQWIALQDWSGAYERQLAAHRTVTSYGQQAKCFSPGAAELYAWLREQAGPDLIVVSNFHEYVALETGIPALPIPKDEAVLGRWIERISANRGVAAPRVLFVLDSDNRWRSYWIPEPASIVQAFALGRRVPLPEAVTASVYPYPSSQTRDLPASRCQPPACDDRFGARPAPTVSAGLLPGA